MLAIVQLYFLRLESPVSSGFCFYFPLLSGCRTWEFHGVTEGETTIYKIDRRRRRRYLNSFLLLTITLQNQYLFLLQILRFLRRTTMLLPQIHLILHPHTHPTTSILRTPLQSTLPPPTTALLPIIPAIMPTP